MAENLTGGTDGTSNDQPSAQIAGFDPISTTESGGCHEPSCRGRDFPIGGRMPQGGEGYGGDGRH